MRATSGVRVAKAGILRSARFLDFSLIFDMAVSSEVRVTRGFLALIYSLALFRPTTRRHYSTRVPASLCAHPSGIPVNKALLDDGGRNSSL